MTSILSADWDSGRGGYSDASNIGTTQRLDFDHVVYSLLVEVSFIVIPVVFARSMPCCECLYYFIVRDRVQISIWLILGESIWKWQYQ